MRMPSALKDLDNRVLGRRRRRDQDGVEDDAEPRERETRVVERQEREPREPRGTGGPGGGTGDGAREALSIVYAISRAVFLLLVLAVVLGIIFILAPTNPDNAVVELVTDVSEGAAGPFRDVFTVDDDAEREQVVNYAFAAGVYLLAALLVRKLPGGKA